MHKSQEDIFAAFEGNRWYERNRGSLEQFDAEKDLPIRIMELYTLNPEKILEIGAADGSRLAHLAERYKAVTVAIEPSIDAVDQGRIRFPGIEFIRGVAHKIPLQGSFDLIIVNFVLHWVDRNNVLRCVAEIDRLLGDGAYLIIGDFLPSNFIKVPYHHLPGSEVYTFKQDYAGIFLASGGYRPIGLLTSDHSSGALSSDVPENERAGVWLLKKVVGDLYVLGGV